MPRPKGLPKTGGRKPGCITKKSKVLNQILEAGDFCTISEIRRIIKEGTLTDKEKCDVLLDLLPYQYPKRMPVTSTGDDANLALISVPVTIEERLELSAASREKK